MSDMIERRFDDYELRDDGADGLTLSGYAAVFDTPTRIDSHEGRFDETITRGAFRKTIRERKPIMQWNHGKDPAVGQVPIGAIQTLREDDRGLYVEARLHDNAHVAPIRDAIASGAVGGMSFRMQVLQDTWDSKGEVPSRRIKEIRLFELGPVDFPAYASTSVGVRADESATTPPPADEESSRADDAGATHNPSWLRYCVRLEAVKGNR